MGNIQNLVCQENSCFDNNYEFDWISEQSWFIDTQSHSNKNNYIIEKGLVKLLSKEKCIYFLSKYIQNQHFDNLLFHLKLDFQLIDEHIEFIFYLSQQKISTPFNKPNKYIISKLIIQNNHIFYVNQKNQLIEIKQHEEKQKNKFSYQLLFNFQYLDYLIINEIYDFHKESKNMLEINKDHFYLNIYINSFIQKKDNYVHFRI